MSADDRPYGFRVTIQRNRAGNVETHVFPSKTKALTQAHQAARYKAGFLRLVSAEPLTEEQWAATFGVRPPKREAVLA